MKKHFYVIALVGLLGFNSCSDSFEPSVDFGDKTYINDYSALVDAVNNLSSTLSERLTALNTLLEQGMYSIKVAIDENTGAIKLQTSALQDGLGTLNTTFLEGFKALNTSLEANGDKMVSAINSNGELIALHLDKNGELVSAQIKGSTADLIKALSDHASTLSTKLDAINTAINTGLTNITTKIDNVDGSIKAQTNEIKNVDTSIKAQTDKIGELSTNVLNGFTGVNSNLSTINTSLGAVNTSLGTVKTAIDDMNKAMGLKLDANTAELQNIVLKINDNTTAISKMSADMATNLKTLNESINAQGGKLVTAINAQGEVIVEAINAQGEVLETIATGINTIGTKLDATNGKLETINGSLSSMNTSLKTINDNIVAINTSLGTINTNIQTLATMIQNGDESIKNAIEDLKKYENGVIYEKNDSNKDGTYKATYVTPEAWGAMDDAAKKALGNTLEKLEANPTGVQATYELSDSYPTYSYLLGLEDHSNAITNQGHVSWKKTGDSGEEVVISSTIIKDGVTLFKVVKVLTYTTFTTNKTKTCGYKNATYVHVTDARGTTWPLDGSKGEYVIGEGAITNVRMYMYDAKTGAFCLEPSGRLYTDEVTPFGIGVSSYNVDDKFYE